LSSGVIGSDCIVDIGECLFKLFLFKLVDNGFGQKQSSYNGDDEEKIR